jgi:peptidoglycan hydrolase-like protein with peptidoglycan-binding domain
MPRASRRAKLSVGASAAVAVVAALIVGGASKSAATVHTNAASATPPSTAAAPLDLTATTPSPGVLPAFSSPITWSFDSPLAPLTATPTLAPAVAGNWTRAGDTLTFTPASEWPPYKSVTVTFPALADLDGGHLAPVSQSFTAPAPDTLRVQQLLAGLGYLPLSFTPSTPGASPDAAAPAASTTTAAPGTTGTPTASPAGEPNGTTGAATTSTSTPAGVAAVDQPGSFTWRWADVPPTLAAEWSPGRPNLITQGAVMAFEADHGLAVDGIAGPQVWAAMVAATEAGQHDPRPYDYITVTQTQPETLTVWQAGTDVYSSLANTGVPGASTATGTYPVYSRFVTTTMRGTNPDGSKYVDPGIPWVAYFNGGDAIHGFVRAAYGFPQSDGCVELPPSHAQTVYPMDYYGTLVDVL